MSLRACLALLTGLLVSVLGAACVVGDRPSAEHLSCEDGTCQCGGGFGNCDGDAANGCEAVLDVDPKNCGACGTACVNGTCEAGQCACSGGFSDCNDDGSDGCEALLKVDPDHCGACGRSCLGGPCSDSRCAPFLLAELGTYIYRLTANPDFVFYCDADAGILFRVAKDDGTVVPLVSDQNCYALAVADGRLFWSVVEHGEELIKVAPIDGGEAPLTLAITRGVQGFAAAGDRVIWIEYDSMNTSWGLFITNQLGQRTAIASSIEPLHSVAVAGNRVFWVEGDTFSDTNRIVAAPLGGGFPTALVTVDLLGEKNAVEAIVVVDDMLYWVQTSAQGEERRISRVRTSGGEPEQIFVRNRIIGTLLGDASGLYWTEDQGDRLLHAPLVGGNVQVLAEFQDITLPVLGTDAVYWIDFPSHLFALAK